MRSRTKTEFINTACTAEQKLRWSVLAEKLDMSLSEMVRLALIAWEEADEFSHRRSDRGLVPSPRPRT